jgi:hypothetical protein
MLDTRVTDKLCAGPIPCARGADGPRHRGSIPPAPARTASRYPLPPVGRCVAPFLPYAPLSLVVIHYFASVALMSGVSSVDKPV